MYALLYKWDTWQVKQHVEAAGDSRHIIYGGGSSASLIVLPALCPLKIKTTYIYDDIILTNSPPDLPNTSGSYIHSALAGGVG